MIIHVVQQGDTIQSIAEYYRTSETVLIQDNALREPDNLVIGQAIVIAYPTLTYTVQEGDTLEGIANSHNVTIIQLLQNNPYLSDREYIYPGDRIVISYEKRGTLATHGNTVPFISNISFTKTLPYLTYISIVNYTATATGEIISYFDDFELIQTAKQYNVIPLMFLTTLTFLGEANIRAEYQLLLDDEYQNTLNENIIALLREKGFSGINISYEYISETTLPYIERAYSRTVARLREEGFLVFATINPNITLLGDELVFQRVDYTELSNLADSIIFMNYEWARNVNPPSPISSIYQMDVYTHYLMQSVPTNMLNLGLATIGYDWSLPYLAGVSSVNSLTIDSAIGLARNEGVAIKFDEISQTPYFRYTNRRGPYPQEHIVWFLDARSINALLDLVATNDLQGVGIWNITVFNEQLWLIINTQFEILKFEVE